MENFSDPKKGAKMNYLVVTAHSGDEILGCGGTIRKLSLTGSSVSVCTLDGSGGNCGGKDEESIEDHRLELRKLGVKESYLLEKRRDSVPFSNLVSFIEKCIVDSNADSIITYHPAIGDRERQMASKAVQKASQLFKRRKNVKPLAALLYMEFPSATDISLDPTVKWFSPNFYVTLSEEILHSKLDALSSLSCLSALTSLETVRSVAVMRGSQSGAMYSEAFESVYIRV